MTAFEKSNRPKRKWLVCRSVRGVGELLLGGNKSAFSVLLLNTNKPFKEIAYNNSGNKHSKIETCKNLRDAFGSQWLVVGNSTLLLSAELNWK